MSYDEFRNLKTYNKVIPKTLCKYEFTEMSDAESKKFDKAVEELSSWLFSKLMDDPLSEDDPPFNLCDLIWHELYLYGKTDIDIMVCPDQSVAYLDPSEVLLVISPDTYSQLSCDNINLERLGFADIIKIGYCDSNKILLIKQHPVMHYGEFQARWRSIA